MSHWTCRQIELRLPRTRRRQWLGKMCALIDVDRYCALAGSSAALAQMRCRSCASTVEAAAGTGRHREGARWLSCYLYVGTDSPAQMPGNMYRMTIICHSCVLVISHYSCGTASGSWGVRSIYSCIALIIQSKGRNTVFSTAQLPLPHRPYTAHSVKYGISAFMYVYHTDTRARTHTCTCKDEESAQTTSAHEAHRLAATQLSSVLLLRWFARNVALSASASLWLRLFALFVQRERSCAPPQPLLHLLTLRPLMPPLQPCSWRKGGSWRRQDPHEGPSSTFGLSKLMDGGAGSDHAGAAEPLARLAAMAV